MSDKGVATAAAGAPRATSGDAVLGTDWIADAAFAGVDGCKAASDAGVVALMGESEATGIAPETLTSPVCPAEVAAAVATLAAVDWGRAVVTGGAWGAKAGAPVTGAPVIWASEIWVPVVWAPVAWTPVAWGPVIWAPPDGAAAVGIGSDGAARDAALADGGVAGAKTGAGASPDGTGEAEGCDVDGEGVGGRAALSLKLGDGGAAWATCVVAAAAAPPAITAGVKTDDAAGNDPPAPGRVGLEVELEDGGARGGWAAAVRGAIAAASCAWMAEDSPGSASVRRGPVGFASAGAPSVAGEAAEASGAKVVWAVDEVERA